MKALLANRGRILVICLILGFLASGCASVTPPGPDLVSAKLENTSYLLLH